MADWKARIAAAFSPKQPDDDILEELAQHAAATYEAARAEGLDVSRAEARVDEVIAAWTRDPGVLRRRPQHAPVVVPPEGAGSSWPTFLQDARYALRLMQRQPAYTALVVATMTLGIAATTVLGSVAYGVLLRPLPWANADRLIRISESRQGSTHRLGALMTNGTYRAWADAPGAIDALAGWSNQTGVLSGTGEPERVRMAAVTPGLFQMIGASPAVGRPFADGSERPGQPKIAIVSYGLWQQRFGGKADAIGGTIRIDGAPFTIVGAMPDGFAFPDREVRLWVPYYVPPPSAPGSGSFSVSLFNGLARLRPGATAEQAAAEGTARARTAPPLGPVGIAVFGSNGPADVTAVPLLDAIVGDVRPAILVLLAGVALLLVTATANIASVQLARATARRREMAIRSALGAASGRLVRQMVVENLLLGLAGGIGGILLAAWIQRALPAVLPADFPRVHDIALDLRLQGLAVLASMAAALAFGLLPALQARRLDLVPALAEDALAPAGGGTRTRVARTRAVIMAGQIAVACVLLLGAALLVRSFNRLTHADIGFDRGNVLMARVTLTDGAYTPAARLQVLDRIVERLRQTPGVIHAAYGANVPFAPGEIVASFPLKTRDRGTIQAQSSIHLVSWDYFGSLGQRIVEGRGFTKADVAGAERVRIVNREFARRYLSGQAVGATIGDRHDGTETTIVGVVEDTARQQVTDTPQPEMFNMVASADELRGSDIDVIVRAASDPRSLIPSLRALAKTEAPDAPLSSISTLDDRVSGTLARPQLYAILLGAFATFAVLIAGVGLFGVLSYTVALRSREIGVRAALGATPRDIIGLVVGQCLRIAAGGILAGLVVSFWLARWTEQLLYGVTAHDAASFAGVAALLTLVAFLAALVPARRAARVDPIRALRA